MNEQVESVALFTPQNMRRQYAKAVGTQQFDMRSMLGRIEHIQYHSNTLYSGEGLSLAGPSSCQPVYDSNDALPTCNCKHPAT